MLNEFRFLGRLAGDPTVAEKYTRFPLAVKQDKRGDAEAETDFFNMTGHSQALRCQRHFAGSLTFTI